MSGMRKVESKDPRSFAERLAAELDRQLTINAKLGEGLLRDLEHVHAKGRPVLDTYGNAVGTAFVPDRDWARCYGHYRTVNKDLLAEERERAELRLKHQQAGAPVLSDEEFQEELRLLGLQAVKALSNDEIAAMLRERGVTVEIPPEVEKDE